MIARATVDVTNAMTLRQLLSDQSDEIVNRFVAALRSGDTASSELPRSLLVDHIPVFLGEIAEGLANSRAGGAPGDAADTSNTAPAHGRQRWQLGYDLASLVREYGILRHAIMESADASALRLTNEEFDMLGKCLTVGVAEAAVEYSRFRDLQLAAHHDSLQFLASAGELLSSSLDYRSTLSRLTRLLVPRLADCCAVHLDDVALDEMPIAHVDPAKAELLRELYRRFPRTRDSPRGYPDVLQSDSSELVTRVEPQIIEQVASGPEHLLLLRQINICSYLVVPLRVQDHLFGALTLIHSDSGRHYTEADLMLASDLARRAAVAIDNARLYQLSQQERSRVEAATRAKDELVAVVSHELRTPLNAILGWVRLLRSGTLSPSKRDHALEVIERNANAQNQLVSDLLDISRAITGKVRIYPSQVDLSNVIDICLEESRLALDAKRIQVHTELDRSGSLMRGDGERLQQIVWNLVTNAIKFTPKGGKISIRLARIESDLELSVSDTGVGIASSFLPHVFDSFRQSDSSAARVHGGLGVGLSISKHLVDLHGGSIEARSDGTGKGATFVVRLPVSPLLSGTVGVSQVPATRPPERLIDLPSARQEVRVLVVDDEPDARELIGYVLESCGMQVRLAATVQAALSELSTYTPDVIISDIGMPQEDGYALIRNIRTLGEPEKKDIPAIALTAFTRNEDRTRALVAGFNLHIAKPVEPAALVRAVLDLAGQLPTDSTPPPSKVS